MVVSERPRAERTGGQLMLTDASPISEGAKRNTIALVALLLVTVAEVLTTYGDPRTGIGMHIALLALCLCLGALVDDPRYQIFFLTLAVAPIIRIASTGMPLHAFPQVYWYLLTSIPLFIAAFSIAQASGIGPAALNLRMPSRRMLGIEAAVWASGLGLGYVEWRILGSDPLVAVQPLSGLIGGALVLLVCTGFVEELLFRGLVQFSAGTLLGPKTGILFSAGLFAVLHIGHRSALDVLFVAAVGLYFSLVVQHTRSLLGVTLAHGTINIVLLIAIPLAVAAHGGDQRGAIIATLPARTAAATRTPSPSGAAVASPPGCVKLQHRADGRSARLVSGGRAASVERGVPCPGRAASRPGPRGARSGRAWATGSSGAPPARAASTSAPVRPSAT